jgi:hypothetical protein
MTNRCVVILSEAKDLITQRGASEMLRCAQHDMFTFVIPASSFVIVAQFHEHGIGIT